MGMCFMCITSHIGIQKQLDSSVMTFIQIYMITFCLLLISYHETSLLAIIPRDLTSN